MKVKIKETYLILLIVLSLISLGVYSTYALFTASTEINDVVGITASLDIGKSITEYEIINIESNDTKIIELNITNSSSSTVYYGAWYKIAEGNSEDVDIGLYTEKNSNSSSGSLSASSNTNLLVGITNNSESTITVYLGVKGSTTNELNLGSDKTLLPSGWSQNYTVDLVVVNGTSNISSAVVTKGGSAVFNITTNRPYMLLGNDNCDGLLNITTGDYTISNVTENKTCTLTLRGPNSSWDVMKYLGLSVASSSPNFSKTSCSSGCGETTIGLFQAQDDLGASYYFRGDVENNYVYFANFYWRIIRINGDGSIRMIYDGTSAHSNGESSTDRRISLVPYNSDDEDNTYVGFMHGNSNEINYNSTHTNTNDSAIKTSLDSWYKTNIYDAGYSTYIADAIYCNDRGLYNGGGYMKFSTTYSAYNRLYTNKIPTLKCSQENDKFTASSLLGNGALTYSVGLITADEVSLAGGLYYQSDNSANNLNLYLNIGEIFWTMTPSEYYVDSTDSNFSIAKIFVTSSNGEISSLWADGLSGGLFSKKASSAMRPVISIYPSAIIYGTGTSIDPFRTNA